jgi:hypothetical protein
MAPDDPRLDAGRQRLAEGATRAAVMLGHLMTLAAILDERTPHRLAVCQAELTAWARRLFRS